MRRQRDAAILILAALVCFGPPIYLFATPAPPPLVPAPADGAMAPVLGSPLLWRSVGVALVAAAVALTVGGALGWSLARAPRRLRPWLMGAAPLPLLMPPYLAAMAWARILSPGGMVVGAPGGALPQDMAPPWLVAGAVLGGWTAPLVALPLAAALPALDGAAVESARMLLRPWRRLRWWCGALRGPLVGGAALAFCLAATNLAAPLVLRADVYPLEVFTRFSVYDLAGAAAATIPLIALGVLALSLRALVVGRAPTAMVGPRWRPARAGSAGAAGLALTLLLVLVALPLSALARDVQGLAQLRRALATAGDELFVTLRVSAMAGVAMLLLGFGVAAALRRMRPVPRRLLGLVLLLPLALPGAAVGLGLQRMAADGVLPAWVAGGSWMLVLAATARFLPLAVLPALVALDRFDPRLDEAARVAGLGRMARARIGAPLIAADLATVAVVGFAFAAGELAAAVLVEPPGTTTLAVRLASLLHFGEHGIVAALSLLLAGVVGITLALAGLLAGRALAPRLDDLR